MMTFPKEHGARVRDEGEAHGWFFSAIAGCPLLGQGEYCYLTNYNKNAHDLLETMKQMEQNLIEVGVPALRTKIEHIVYDTKTGVNEL